MCENSEQLGQALAAAANGGSGGSETLPNLAPSGPRGVVLEVGIHPEAQELLRITEAQWVLDTTRFDRIMDCAG